MKINNNFFGLKISASGLSVQRKKMNIIAENIANSSTTRTDDGTPYQRKFMIVTQEQNGIISNSGVEGVNVKMNISNPTHFETSPQSSFIAENKSGLKTDIKEDATPGDTVFMPDHPDADKDGYVHMPNVNVITEMIDMIAATRSYEANLTAFNASKQMAKDSLEI